jgi:hypothetical protein
MMKVINVAGFNVRFEKDGVIYNIPYDNHLHVIPDKCFFEDSFQGLLRVIIPPISTKSIIKQIESNKTIDINEPNIKEIIIEKVEEKKNKPLIGVKIKKNIRSSLKNKTKKV